MAHASRPDLAYKGDAVTPQVYAPGSSRLLGWDEGEDLLLVARACPSPGQTEQLSEGVPELLEEFEVSKPARSVQGPLTRTCWQESSLKTPRGVKEAGI